MVKRKLPRQTRRLNTLEFTVVPGKPSHPPTCDACRTTFFMIDRGGHPLI